MIAMLLSVFGASLVGSLHCVGMCGPFAALACAPPDRVHLSTVSAVRSAGAYNGGRLVTYVLLGTAAGAVGLALDGSGAWLGISRAAAAIAGVSMVVVGVLGLLRAAGARWPTASSPVSRRRGISLAARVLRSANARVTRLSPHRRAFALGAITTLMPCGWLWAFVIAAAGTGSPASGAALMLVFWTGTLPAMLFVGTGAQLLAGRARTFVPWVMPALITAVGLYALVFRMPLPVGEQDAAADPATAAPCHQEAQ